MEAFHKYLLDNKYSTATISQYLSIIKAYACFLFEFAKNEGIESIKEFLNTKGVRQQLQILPAFKAYYSFKQSPILFELNKIQVIE